MGRFSNLLPVALAGAGVARLLLRSNWQFVALLLASIAFNYLIGLLLITSRLRTRLRFAVLTLGVAGDLLVLGYFKYAGFFAANLDALLSAGLHGRSPAAGRHILLHLHPDRLPGDAYRGKVAGYRLPHYALFVTYFPHLIAGPILHHKDMIPQLSARRASGRMPHLFCCGLIIFAIGLFKKTCLADGIQPYVGAAFGPATPSFVAGLDRRAGLHLPALFRFLRLFRHGDRPVADVRHAPAAEFQFALQGHQHHRFLAALAHDAVAVPARLSLYPARRQPPWRGRCATST